MVITNWDVMCFYLDKKEHYSISDDFIKQYQQKTLDKNSYINYALNTRHLICEALAEPNQKWHLLDAYFLHKILKNGAEYLGEKTTCNRLSCPELLLWMAEAAEVSLEVINIAYVTAKEKIDDIRKRSGAYSAIATQEMNKKLKEKYDGKCLWDFIEEKIVDWKRSKV